MVSFQIWKIILCRRSRRFVVVNVVGASYVDDRFINNNFSVFIMDLYEQHDDGPGFVGIKFCKEW